MHRMTPAVTRSIGARRARSSRRSSRPAAGRRRAPRWTGRVEVARAASTSAEDDSQPGQLEIDRAPAAGGDAVDDPQPGVRAEQVVHGPRRPLVAELGRDASEQGEGDEVLGVLADPREAVVGVQPELAGPCPARRHAAWQTPDRRHSSPTRPGRRRTTLECLGAGGRPRAASRPKPSVAASSTAFGFPSPRPLLHSPGSARQRRASPASRARIPRNSGTYQLRSGWRSSSASAVNTAMSRSTAAKSPSSRSATTGSDGRAAPTPVRRPSPPARRSVGVLAPRYRVRWARQRVVQRRERLRDQRRIAACCARARASSPAAGPRPSFGRGGRPTVVPAASTAARRVIGSEREGVREERGMFVARRSAPPTPPDRCRSRARPGERLGAPGHPGRIGGVGEPGPARPARRPGPALGRGHKQRRPPSGSSRERARAKCARLARRTAPPSANRPAASQCPPTRHMRRPARSRWAATTACSDGIRGQPVPQSPAARRCRPRAATVDGVDHDVADQVVAKVNPASARSVPRSPAPTAATRPISGIGVGVQPIRATSPPRTGYRRPPPPAAPTTPTRQPGQPPLDHRRDGRRDRGRPTSSARLAP